MRGNPNLRDRIAALALLIVSCGGQTGDNGASQAQVGGASSAGGTMSNGGDLSNGGVPSINTSHVGCPGQPLIAPQPDAAISCTFSLPQPPQRLYGIRVTVLKTLDVSSSGTCVYPAPVAMPIIVNSSLGEADPTDLSVWFFFVDGTAEMFPNVMSAADCTASSGGWYLDSITDPTTVTFCPCTCDRLGSIHGTIYMVDFPPICLN